jgi:hypothetical protein
MRVPCASGLIFDARKWKIGDISELVGTKDREPTTLPKKMVELAATGIVESGPYNFPDNTLDTSQMSIADISIANILIRVGIDSILSLRPTCGACKRQLRDPIDVPLDEMPIFMASQEGVESLRTGAPVKRQYGDVTLHLKAALGADLATLAMLREQAPKYVVEYMHVVHIAEVHDPKLKEPLNMLAHSREWYHEQDMPLHSALDEDIDELWGGVDQSYDYRCDHMTCRTEQEGEVPLDLTFYGLERQTRRSRRAKRSSAMKSAGELMHSSSAPSSSDTQTTPTSTSEG